MNAKLTNDLKVMIKQVQDLACGHSFQALTLDQNLEYILECLGPTLMDLKPAELLSVGVYEERAWEEFKTLLTQNPEVGLIEIRYVNKRRQVLFYNRRILDQRLNSPVIQDFLKRLQYPHPFTMDRHLKHLIQKIRFEEFPHEIGIFLGYPLKDVWGFMGWVPLPYVKTQGWRVYGDTTISDQWYERYQNARRLMNEALAH